jgi:molecular chaperone HtpG
MELILFHSTHSDKMTTLEEYVGRMREDQKDIYFITGDTLAQISHSPYLEKLKEKNYEVLLLVDPVDEWVVDAISTYKEKKLQSIMKEGLGLDTESEKQQIKEAELILRPVLDSMKKTLENDVKDVVLSERLTSTPVCLVASSQDPSAHMQKLLSQMEREHRNPVKRIMEINPKHPVFEKMLKASPEQRTQWAEILFAQALLNEGSNIPDPVRLSQQIAELMIQAAEATKH